MPGCGRKVPRCRRRNGSFTFYTIYGFYVFGYDELTGSLAWPVRARASERPMTINGRSYGRMKSASARVHCYDSYKYISINHRGDVVCVCMQHLGAGDSGDDLVASLLFAIHNSIRAPTILVWHCHRLSFHCLKLKLSTPQVAYEFHLFRTVKG